MDNKMSEEMTKNSKLFIFQ